MIVAALEEEKEGMILRRGTKQISLLANKSYFFCFKITQGKKY